MPSKIKKSGKNSYLLTVSAGYDANGKQITHTTTVKASSDREAVKQYALFLAKIQKGQVATSGKMTLEEFYEYFIEHYAEQNNQPGTIVYNNDLFVRINHTLGHLRLDKIEPKHLLAFYNNLTEPGIKIVNKSKTATDTQKMNGSYSTLHPNTIRKYHALLHTLFAKAVQWQFIPYNPADKVEPPKSIRSQKSIYTSEQTAVFLDLLDKAPLKYRLMCSLALGLGARREEIFGLEWQDIDFNQKLVSIKRASVYLRGKGIITGPPKNSSSLRTVSAPDSVMELLQQYKSEQDASRLELGNKWEGNDRIFTQWNGAPAHPHSFTTWLRRFANSHDLPKISPHCFRHLSVSFLIRSGVDIETISKRIGHAMTSTTLNNYGHVLQKYEYRSANILNGVMKTKVSDKTAQREQG